MNMQVGSVPLRLHRALTFVGVLLVLAVMSPATALADGVVSGIVRGAGDVGAVGNAEVAVFTVDAFNGYATTVVASTTSDADGFYSLSVPAGTYIVGARHADVSPDFQYFLPRRGGNAMNPITAVANSGLVPVADQAVVGNIDLRLEYASFVEGMVRRAVDGEPLGGIVVSSVQWEPGEGWHLIEETVTRPDGTYRLQTLVSEDLGVPGEPGKIQFRDPGMTYATSVYDGEIYLAAGLDFDFEPGEVVTGVDACLTVGGAISGRIFDAVTNAALPGITVDLYRLIPLLGVYEPVDLELEPVLSDATGAYRWGGLPPGTYKVKFASMPVEYGPRFYENVIVTDPNTVPTAATPVVVAEATEVTGIDGAMSLFDGAAPVTTSNITSAWRAPGFVVTLSATDPVVPGTGVSSGVAWTRYQVGSGPVTYGTSFPVNDINLVTVRFRSGDHYGNIETTKTATVRIDGTPPVTTSDAVPDYLDSALVTLSASDSQSGVAQTFYRINNGPVRQGTSVRVFGEGSQTVRFWSQDNVGNVEAQKQVSIKIIRTDVEWEVLSGSDRIGTSIEISKKAYPEGSAPKAVIVANAFQWADALSGAPLAGAVDGPILLVDPARPARVLAEVERLKGLGATKAFVLGGENSIPATIEWALMDAFGGDSVERLGGRTRYDTSRRIADKVKAELGPQGFEGTAFFASGSVPFDALAASPTGAANGWPIILVEPAANGAMHARTRSHMIELGVDRAIIVGGPRSVDPLVASELTTLLQGAVQRLSGGDRYATATAIANWSVAEAGMTYDGLAIANDSAFADALSGAALLGNRGSVLVLTSPVRLSQPTDTFLRANRTRIFSVTFLGGEISMPPAIRASVLGRLQ